MPVCQRVFRPEINGDAFAVTELTDERRVADSGARMCGKPAFFKQVSETGDVVIWICVDCFNEFEAIHGEGAWTDIGEFDEDFDEFEEES
jgi:hypothetical protein